MNTESYRPSAAATEDSDIINVTAIVVTLWQQRVLIAAVTFVFILLSVFYVVRIATPMYQSSSVVLLEVQGQELVDIGAVLPSLGADSEAINTEVEVLRSRRLLEQVVLVTDLTSDPEFNSALTEPSLWDKTISTLLGDSEKAEKSPEAQRRFEIEMAIDTLLSKISVRNVQNSFVLRIMVETEGADKSRRIADAIAEQYVLYQMNVKFEATQDASEWLGSRVSDLKIELEEAEARLNAFTSGSEVISAESVELLEVQLKELRERLRINAASLSQAQLRLTALEGIDGKPADEVLAVANDGTLRRLYERDGMSDAFNERLAQIQRAALQEQSQFEQQVRALTSRIPILEAEIADQREELVQIQQLRRETEASRLLYEYFLSRLKETSAREGVQQPDSRILSDAVLPVRPSAPNKKMIVVFATMFGFLTGAAIALGLEARKQTYREGSELELDTGVRVMGQVPVVPSSKRRQAIDYMIENPTSAAAEAIRNLRTSILLSGRDGDPKRIMISSATPGEGKTTISFSLAHNLTGLGKKVLLIEGDIRRRVFQEYLETKDAKGVLAVMSGEAKIEDVVIFDERLQTDILISEVSQQNAADVLASPAFGKLLERADELYDMIIIDTPPVLVVPDARIVAQQVDIVLMNVRWDETSRKQVHLSLDMFSSVGVTVDGLVLNLIDPKGMKRYGYGDTYGAYSMYGASYYGKQG